jgi:hypothetical protein
MDDRIGSPDSHLHQGHQTGAGNLAQVVRATWGFGGFELQAGSLETSRLNKGWAPSAGRRDVEADVEGDGDGEYELRERRR